MDEPGRLVTIGKIARPHGLRGELRVTPLTDDPDRFSRLVECVLWDAARDRRERRRLRGARRHGPAVVLSLAGDLSGVDPTLQKRLDDEEFCLRQRIHRDVRNAIKPPLSYGNPPMALE